MCCTVGKCCFCVSLRAGAIAFASVWLLGDVVFLAWQSFAAYSLDREVKKLTEEGYWDEQPEQKLLDQVVYIGLFSLTVVFVVLCIVAIPLDIMLLFGAINRRARLLHGWTVAYAVLYALFLLDSLASLAVSFYFSPAHALGVFAVFLLHAGLTVHFWTVVRSYYLELDQQHGEGGRAAGKVYRAVPPGDVPPARGTFCHGSGSATQTSAPPRYTSCA